MSDPTYETGMRVRREVLGDEHVDRAIAETTAFTAAFQEHLTRTAWGSVWSRPGLDRRTRSCVTLAVLAALGREGEIPMHVRAARRLGVTPEEIAEVLLLHLGVRGHPGRERRVPGGQEALAVDGLVRPQGERMSGARTSRYRGRTSTAPPGSVVEGHRERGNGANAGGDRRRGSGRSRARAPAAPARHRLGGARGAKPGARRGPRSRRRARAGNGRPPRADRRRRPHAARGAGAPRDRAPVRRARPPDRVRRADRRPNDHDLRPAGGGEGPDRRAARRPGGRSGSRSRTCASTASTPTRRRFATARRRRARARAATSSPAATASTASAATRSRPAC